MANAGGDWLLYPEGGYVVVTLSLVASTLRRAGSRGRRCSCTPVEDQVQHVKHRSYSGRPLFVSRHLKRHTRGLDALLRPADVLGHGRLELEASAWELRRPTLSWRPIRTSTKEEWRWSETR
jgi:hypothetical protein